MEKAKVDPKLISLKSEIITKENEEEIVETVSELSIPRLVGTENEKKAVQLIVDKFHKIGLKIKKYGFWATHYWTDIFIRRSLAVLLLLGIAVAISSTRNLDWTFAIMIIMAICGVFIFRNLTRQ